MTIRIVTYYLVFCKLTTCELITKEKEIPGGEYNSGLPRDRQGY